MSCLRLQFSVHGQLVPRQDGAAVGCGRTQFVGGAGKQTGGGRSDPSPPTITFSCKPVS